MGTLTKLEERVKQQRERRAFERLLEEAGLAHAGALCALEKASRLWGQVLSEGERLGLIGPRKQAESGR